jgi:hypothetical protein
LQEICQFHQIFIPEIGPAGRDGYEWIDWRHARPTRWNGAHAPIIIEVIHTVLTPVVPIADMFELSAKQWVKRMRHPEMFPRTVTTGCS